jgi:hypothetical protein
MGQAVHLRKYGVQTTVTFDLFEVDGVDFRVDAVHASGDTKLMKDEAAEANTTNGFTDEGQGYSIVLTATEMQAARLVLYIVDQTATKVWLDRTVVIETYGNASAMHAMDFDDAVRGGMTALPNAAADAAGGLPISDAGGLDLDTQIGTDIDAILADTNELQGDWVNGGRLDLLLDAIPTTAMRGTDNAALASVCTEARLAELGAANLPADIDAILADTNELQGDWTNTGRLDTILDSILADTNILQTEWADGGRLDVLLDGASAPSAATVADAVWDEAKADHVGVGSFGELAAAVLADTDILQSEWADGGRLDVLLDGASAPSAATVADAVWDEATAGHVAAGSFGKAVADVLADTNELQGDWANGGRLDLLLDAIPTTAMRGTDNAALASVCTEARLAELGATNLPADIDAILADTNELQTDNIPGTLATIAAYLDTEIDAILADTNELQTDWANGGRLDLLLDAIPTTAMRGTDNAATAAALATHDGKLDTVDTVVDAIKVITDLIGATAAANLARTLGAAGVVYSTVKAGTLSTTQNSTNLTEVTDNHYNGRSIIWITGVLAGQASDVTAYVGVNGVLTFTAVTEAASAGDGFILV